MKLIQRQTIIFRAILIFFTCSLLFGFHSRVIIPQKSYIDESLSLNTSLDENLITVRYNTQTKTEVLGDIRIPHTTSTDKTIVAPYVGDPKIDEFKLSFPFPPDDRVRINNTTAYPWRTICKLYITAANDDRFIGSGAMLDEFHVLTCGHCVYLHDNGGWASEIRVVPGMRGPYEPFGHAFATDYRSYAGWIDDEMVEHDWAVITLDRTIGSQTGWMGRKTADPSDPIYTGTLNLAGYPGDLDLGEYMYFDGDYGEDADEYNHWFWMDTAAGQSGSPVWLYDGENRFILTIFAYGYEYGAYANFGTRLNQDKFDRINTWLDEDIPPNNNEEDPKLIYIIPIIITIGVVVLIGVTIFIVIRKKHDIRKLEPFQDISNSSRAESEIVKPSESAIVFCPICGASLLQQTQKYCQNCGFNFSKN